MEDNLPQSPFSIYSPLYYDEERSRFVRSFLTPPYLLNWMFGFYPTQRPDLYGTENAGFRYFTALTWKVLNNIQKFRAMHMLSLYQNYRGIDNSKKLPLAHDFIERRNFVELPAEYLRLWHWDDSTKMYQWMQLMIGKMIEYGLHVPIFKISNVTDSGLKKMEDDLTKKFIAEMSKPPYKS